MKCLHYIVGIAAGCFGMYLVWIGAVDAARGRWVGLSTTQISGWCDAKRAAAREIKGRKLLVMGGSASLYGIDSKILEECLGVPAVNFATHAALPLDYHVFEAKQILNKGDTVLFVAEYVYFEAPYEINKVALNYLLNGPSGFLDSASPARSRETKLGAPLAMIPDAFYSHDEVRSVRRFQRATVRASQMLDERGNMMGHHHAERTEAQFAWVMSLGPLGLLTEQDRIPLTEGLEDFSQWCSESGIQFYLSFANTVQHPEYETAEARLAQEKLVRNLSERNLVVIGEPSDFVFPADDFFDSSYHLTKEASQRRASALCEMLGEAGVFGHPGGPSAPALDPADAASSHE